MVRNDRINHPLVTDRVITIHFWRTYRDCAIFSRHSVLQSLMLRDKGHLQQCTFLCMCLFSSAGYFHEIMNENQTYCWRMCRKWNTVRTFSKALDVPTVYQIQSNILFTTKQSVYNYTVQLLSRPLSDPGMLWPSSGPIVLLCVCEIWLTCVKSLCSSPVSPPWLRVCWGVWRPSKLPRSLVGRDGDWDTATHVFWLGRVGVILPTCEEPEKRNNGELLKVIFLPAVYFCCPGIPDI